MECLRYESLHKLLLSVLLQIQIQIISSRRVPLIKITKACPTLPPPSRCSNPNNRGWLRLAPTIPSSISNQFLSNLCSSSNNNCSSPIHLSPRKERKTSTPHHRLLYMLSKNQRPRRLDLSQLRIPRQASSSSRSLLRTSWRTNSIYNNPIHKRSQQGPRARLCSCSLRSRSIRRRGVTSGSSSTRLGNSSSNNTTARSNSNAISRTSKASSNVTRT